MNAKRKTRPFSAATCPAVLSAKQATESRMSYYREMMSLSGKPTATYPAKVALLLLLAIPVNATDPTVDQLVQAYAGAPWVLVPTEDGQKFYCIDELNSRRVDWIVTKIAEHAKGASCS